MGEFVAEEITLVPAWSLIFIGNYQPQEQGGSHEFLCALGAVRQGQIIAGLAEEYPMSHISHTLGVPRATLYGELKRIRQVFQDQGLNQFSNWSDTSANFYV